MLKQIASFATESGAEILTYDPSRQAIYVVSGGSSLEVLSAQDPANLSSLFTLDLAATAGVPLGGANSVAYKNGLLAIAVAAEEKTDPGLLILVNLDTYTANPTGSVQVLTVGALPDMVTFSPDGRKLLVANEGEPGDTIDPDGSVSIIDVTAGVGAAILQTVDFTAYNGREVELRANGVRIFPDASASEDFEPEYISISPDGGTAFVTLQENNAVAIIDMASAKVKEIVPLGVKDFSRGEPRLTTYDITNRGPITNGGTPLHTAAGETVELGGFSGLWFDGVAANGNLKFLVIPDRGPNGDPIDGNRPFLLPDYQARLLSLEVNETSGAVTITNQLFLRRPDGMPITGLPNIPKIDERAVDALGNPVNLPQLSGFETFGSDYDPLGADLEGIVRAPDGSYWMVDEYRPAIYHFGSDGVLINRFVPQGTVSQANTANPGANFAPGSFGQETLPTAYLTRRENRGFEGMALDTDNGILYAFIQTPLSNPNRAAGNASRVIRMIGINPSTGVPVAEYVYLLQKPQVGDNVDKIGDAVYAGNGKFFVMERDSSLEATAQKFIFEVNLTGATNVLGRDLGNTTLEQQSPDQLAALGIQPLNKLKVTNLPSLGYRPTDKPEGLAYLPDGRLAVINDNDFGVVPGVNRVQLGLIDFPQGNRLDASDRDGGINLQNWPVYGFKMPDSIASYTVNGVTYFVTANEGDDRGDADAEGRGDAIRVKNLGDVVSLDREGLALDQRFAPDLGKDATLGRLIISSIDGDLDGDGDLDQLFSYSSRSFSIYDQLGNLVFDSGDDFERITAELTPELFNADSGDPTKVDTRSDNKGPEPEALTLGQVNGRTYAFIGLERAGGGIMVYDITNPMAPKFLQYIRNDSDISPEGLAFVPAADSPNGQNLLLVAHEISGTVSVFTFNPPTPEPPADGFSSPLLDLRDITGLVTASFTVNREAAFDNFVGFYGVTSETGGIDITGDGIADLNPGDLGYTKAAVEALTDLALTTPNLRESLINADLAGGSLYAPLMVVNGTADNYQDKTVLFAFAAANPDGLDHVRVSNGQLAFEDLLGPNSDRDFNDLVIGLDFI